MEHMGPSLSLSPRFNLSPYYNLWCLSAASMLTGVSKWDDRCQMLFMIALMLHLA